MSNQVKPYIAGIVIFLLSLGLLSYIDAQQRNERAQEHRSQAISYLSAIRAKLESTFYANIFLTKSLTTLVAVEGSISSEKFNRLAQELISNNPNIRNIGLAEGYILNKIYPLEGNEEALGLNYRNHPEQWPAVKRAIESRQTIVAGPVELVQGGRAFINRTPIFFADSLATGNDSGYWGLASVVINMDTIFAEVGLPDLDTEFDIAIRGKDGLGASGDVFFGNPQVLQQSPVTLNVTFPNGSWQLAAIPKGGWSATSNATFLLRISGLLIAILLSALTIITYRDNRHLRHAALHDQLTGLPNRVMLDERVNQSLAQAERNRTHLAVAVLDLNGFKSINDTHGHLIGDLALIEVANRMKNTLRNADTPARTGGDEFTVLLPDIRSPKDGAIIAEKLSKAIRKPMQAKDQILEISCSIGISVYPVHGKDLTTLFRRADEAMYKAKTSEEKDWSTAYTT